LYVVIYHVPLILSVQCSRGASVWAVGTNPLRNFDCSRINHF
jgi:hypothetical protein